MYKLLSIFVLGLLLTACQDEPAIQPKVGNSKNVTLSDSTTVKKVSDDPPAATGNGRP
ncbi:hypothetical protein VB776_15775 [Arcicella sp. DC2W]|uniref:Uncharacterized protein n=1 Tax=Arcicella gelida TaxID=2984195 RepID=A0ABU5S7D9_9BACT|nr:hypothetical protein [Arcicella sp. DC2W]MEA5404392.1 hypothetical protein [Arcicella sp. DC2W]